MTPVRDKDANLYLGCDISSFKEPYQFGILFSTLLFFMCLYNVFQEMVIYDWFDRKLGVFTAALHFLGCIFCAAILHVFAANSFREGVASLVSAPKAPITSYFGLCVLKVSATWLSCGRPMHSTSLPLFCQATTQLFTNISMQHVNFTTKIILKSSMPVVTMILGFTIQRHRYSLSEMFAVLVLTIGLMVFLMGDNMSLPEGSSIGLSCVFISLISAALTPMWQEHLNDKYNASSSEMLLHLYTGSFFISLVLTFVFDEMHAGLEVLRTTSTPFNIMSLLCFCTFAFLGTNSSIGIITRYGSLTNGICNSARKVLSIIISILAFPTRNGITMAQLFGIALFSGGLFLRSTAKKAGSPKEVVSQLEPAPDSPQSNYKRRAIYEA